MASEKYLEAGRLIRFAIMGAIALSSLAPPATATEFSKPLNVSRSRARIDTLAAIAVDPDNKVHVAWNAFFAKAGAPDGVAGDIYYSTNASGKFSAPLRIRVPGGWYSRDAAIAVDRNGHVHIVFRRSLYQSSLGSEDDIYYVTDARGDLKHPIRLVDGKYGSGLVSSPYRPAVHCDGQNHVHVTFEGHIGDQGDLVLYMNNRSGTWTKPALAVQGNLLNGYSSCLDRNGFIHIAYESATLSPENRYQYRIFYVNNRSGKFSKPVVASASKHTSTLEPQVAADARGKAHIVYRSLPDVPQAPSIYYVNNVSGGFKSWQPLCDVNVYYIPQIAVDSANIVHIAYKITPPYGGHLYYGNNRTGRFEFSSYKELSPYCYGWPKYFALGKSGTLHFAVYDFPDPESWEAEIYYFSGSWLK